MAKFNTIKIPKPNRKYIILCIEFAVKIQSRAFATTAAFSADMNKSPYPTRFRSSSKLSIANLKNSIEKNRLRIIIESTPGEISWPEKIFVRLFVEGRK